MEPVKPTIPPTTASTSTSTSVGSLNAKPEVGKPAPVKAPLTPSASAPKMVQAPPPFALGRASGVGKYLKLFVYSNPGKGKTELVCSAADVAQMKDVLFVDIEKGDMTIQDNPRIKNWEDLMENRVPINSFTEVAKVHDWLKGHVKARDANNIEALRREEARLRGVPVEEIIEPKKFYTVILDSATEIDKFSNYELLGVSEAKVLDGSSDEQEVAGWDEFRKNNQRIQMLFRAFRDLPLHVLVTAHEQYKQDELKKFHYEPNLTGQLARQVLGFFDIVGRLDFHKQGEKNERRFYVQPVSNFMAKNRRSVFKEDFFINPNMTDIMTKTGLMKPPAP